MEAGMATDRGRCREKNEDSLGRRDSLFVLADGMGGHNAGEIASAMVVEEILRMDTELETGDFLSSLPAVLNKANQILLDYAQRHPDCHGMGTTVALVKIAAEEIIVGHLGDSRVYLWREDVITQLTRDHSVVEELVRGGGITEEEAKCHPHRNLLTKALGTPGEVDVEITTLPVHKGDRILMCTDGLTSMLEEEEIKRILSADASAQQIAELLIKAANNRGGSDNITVVVIKL